MIDVKLYIRSRFVGSQLTSEAGQSDHGDGFIIWIFALRVKDELLTHVHSYSFCVADEFLLLESVNQF